MTDPTENSGTITIDSLRLSVDHILAILEAAFVAGASRTPDEFWAEEAEHYAKTTVVGIIKRGHHK